MNHLKNITLLPAMAHYWGWPYGDEDINVTVDNSGIKDAGYAAAIAGLATGAAGLLATSVGFGVKASYSKDDCVYN